MRIVSFLFALCALLLCASPSLASLPHYNSDMGYTIWLPRDWTVASQEDLAQADGFHLPVQGMSFTWEAGYFSADNLGGCRLFVEAKPGRKMFPADISNFNSFIIRSLKRNSFREERFAPCATLKDATYFQDKKILRLETLAGHGADATLGLTYIVYTRKGMLTFVGAVALADEHALEIIDKAVLSLYLDDSLRY